MEGRIGNHGNQEESSKEGQQEETLIGHKQKNRGDAKASPKFLCKVLMNWLGCDRDGNLRQPFFGFWAKRAIGAEVAVITRLRIKLPCRNPGRNLFHLEPRL